MRYLQNRNQFLNRKVELKSSNVRKEIENSRLIRETMENDITWGGSLLGRLINSIIRKAKIYYKTAKITSVISAVQKELDQLLWDVTTNKSQKNRLQNVTVRFILEEIYDVTYSDDELAKKLTKLVGSKTSDDDGLVNQALKDLEDIPEESFPKKKELITKLQNYKDKLQELDWDSSEPEDAPPPLANETQEKFVEKVNDFLESFIILTKKMDEIKIEPTKPGEEMQVGDIRLLNGKKVKVLSLNKLVRYNPQSKKYDEVKDLTPEQICILDAGNMIKVVKKTDLKEAGNLSGSQFRDKNNAKNPVGDTDATKNKNLYQDEKENFYESLYYMNESLPIFEDISIKTAESINAWKKILQKKNKFKEISDKIVKIQDDYADSEILELGKSIVKKIKEVSKNPFNYKGKKGYEGLILEKVLDDEDTFVNEICELWKIIISFKNEPGKVLLQSYGEVGEAMLKIIKSYSTKEGGGGFLEIYQKLDSESKDKEKEEGEGEPQGGQGKAQGGQGKAQGGQEVQDNQNSRVIYDFRKFKMFEEYAEDEAEEIWETIFEEGEEKEWKVKEAEAKELQNETDDVGKEPFPIEEESCRDHIIRIVNLFARAYRLYATDYIPSGRPKGRTSLKTHREYEYIGDSTTVPEFNDDQTAGYGPWAAKITFEKWQDGIMNILEDTKYRKILANARFLPKNVEELGSGETASQGRGSTEQYPEKVVRAGRSLLDFMNDLLSGTGPFNKIKRKVISEYFKGADVIDKETEKELRGATVLKSKSKGDTNKAMFKTFADLKRVSSGKIEILKYYKEGGDYENEFIQIDYKDGGNNKTLIGFVMGLDRNKKALWIKFCLEKGRKSQNPFVKTYLKDKMTNDGLELDDTVLPKGGATPKVYLGAIVIEKQEDKSIHLNNRSDDKKLKMKYSEITSKNKLSSDIEKLEILIENMFILSTTSDGWTWEPVKLKQDEQKDYLVNDIEKISSVNNNNLNNLLSD